MNEILTKRSGNILRIQFKRPAKNNAMTLAMCTGLANLLSEADKNENINVVLLHGAGYQRADRFQQAPHRSRTLPGYRRRNYHSDPLRHLMTDLDGSVKSAQSDGADVVVGPFDDPIGRDAVIQG
jgi:hypothetical protein